MACTEYREGKTLHDVDLQSKSSSTIIKYLVNGSGSPGGFARLGLPGGCPGGGLGEDRPLVSFFILASSGGCNTGDVTRGGGGAFLVGVAGAGVEVFASALAGGAPARCDGASTKNSQLVLCALV